MEAPLPDPSTFEAMMLSVLGLEGACLIRWAVVERTPINYVVECHYQLQQEGET
jgi:hypothetical protein